MNGDYGRNFDLVESGVPGRSLNSIVVFKGRSEIPVELVAPLRAFLDNVAVATPFQDPLFCGDGALGGGLASHHFVVWDGTNVRFYAYCTENYAFSRAAPFLRNTFVFKGPIASTEESFRDGTKLLCRWARSRGSLRLRMNPQLENQHISWLTPLVKAEGWRFESVPVAQGTMLLDIDVPISILMTRLHKSARYEIKRAARMGVVISRASSQLEAEAFFEVYRKRGRQKGFGTLDSATFGNLMGTVLEDTTRGALLLAYLKDQLLGGILVLRTGHVAHYVYGASGGDLGNAAPVGYPALWEAICWSKETGAKQFDFGGYSRAGDPNVMRVKRRFGGRQIEFVPPLNIGLWRGGLTPILCGRYGRRGSC